LTTTATLNTENKENKGLEILLLLIILELFFATKPFSHSVTHYSLFFTMFNLVEVSEQQKA